MARRKRATLPDAPMNMTSLIDVVFLLIVFFMLVGEMAKQDMITLVLPQALRSESDQMGPQRLILNISREGDLWVKGKKLTHQQLQHELDQWATRTGRDAAQLATEAVKIRADSLTEWRHMQDVMLDCMFAKVWMVTFGATPTRTGDYVGGETPDKIRLEAKKN